MLLGGGALLCTAAFEQSFVGGTETCTPRQSLEPREYNIYTLANDKSIVVNTVN